MVISTMKGASSGGPTLIPEVCVARRWGKSRRTMLRMRQSGSGPDFVKIGRSIFYLAADIAAFEQASRKISGGKQ